MRTRNIKPGFYENEDLLECSVWARLIFPGLWMMADKAGRLEDRPRKIKIKLLPCDNVNVDDLLEELETHGFIRRYSVDGRGYIQINNFEKHQSPHPRESESTIPPPEMAEKEVIEQDVTESREKALPGREKALPGREKALPGREKALPGRAALLELELEKPQSDFSDEKSLVASVPLTTRGESEKIESQSSPDPPPAGIENRTPSDFSLRPQEKINGPPCKPGFPPCPHQEIIALYAKHLPDLPQPRAWEGVRLTHLASRWRWVLNDLKHKGKAHDRDAGLDFFRRMFLYIGSCDFLMGRTKNVWGGCDLVWIVKAENFLKIIEGKYQNQEAA